MACPGRRPSLTGSPSCGGTPDLSPLLFQRKALTDLGLVPRERRVAPTADYLNVTVRNGATTRAWFDIVSVLALLSLRSDC